MDGFIATDETQNPKTFDAWGSRWSTDAKTKVETKVSINWIGIYEHEGDTLKLCFVSDYQKVERPKEFKAKPATLLILKRDKQ